MDFKTTTITWTFFKFYFDKKFLADFKFTFMFYGFECMGTDFIHKNKAFGVYQRLKCVSQLHHGVYMNKKT